MREEDSWRHQGDDEARRRRGGGRRGHGRGPEWGGRPGFGGPPGFPGLGSWLGDPRMMRGPRAKRGDVRAAALALLAEGPMNGYQIIQEISERSGGVWRPSPGSVYPALQQLEDEGLIRTQESDGRKLFAITDEGRTAVAERGAERPAPWEQTGDGANGMHELGRLMREVAHAFAQVMRTGSEGQIAKAAGVLAGTRRDLYRILADGDTAGSGESSSAPDTGADAGTVDEDK